jgi:RNA polymerase sigma factor (sigma-70 family)
MKSNLIGRSIFALVLLAVGWAEPAIAGGLAGRPLVVRPRPPEFSRPGELIHPEFPELIGRPAVRNGSDLLPDEPISLSEQAMLSGGHDDGKLEAVDIRTVCVSSEERAALRIRSALKISAKRLGAQAQDVDDSVQNTFVSMMLACKQLLVLQNPAGYVYKILKNKIAEYYRTRARQGVWHDEKTEASAVAGPDDQAAIVAFRDLITRLFVKLTEREAQVFVRWGRGESIASTSKELKIGNERVKELRQQIKAKLRQLDMCFDDSSRLPVLKMSGSCSKPASAPRARHRDAAEGFDHRYVVEPRHLMTA